MSNTDAAAFKDIRGQVKAHFWYNNQEYHSVIVLQKEWTSERILLEIKQLTESLIETMARVGALKE